MNRVDYLTELMKNDVKLICIAEKDVEQMKLNLADALKRAEEKCDSYEKMYEGDDRLIMTAYDEYEAVRSPLTQLEALLRDFKICLINHYEQLLIEKQVYNHGIGNSLDKSKKNLLKMDETVEIIKGVLI
ncbi:hypothetical protein [uncultured Methanobrevibacter sp.]|uniref:hypothetical protein n=1 Tax=uncultured Methanobrevibacter sp. TaxID=253161 RepID=UPI0025EA2EE0|nr:hypothetical protein [uncultured Methanobrevibacter sp.]